MTEEDRQHLVAAKIRPLGGMQLFVSGHLDAPPIRVRCGADESEPVSDRARIDLDDRATYLLCVDVLVEREADLPEVARGTSYANLRALGVWRINRETHVAEVARRLARSAPR